MKRMRADMVRRGEQSGIGARWVGGSRFVLLPVVVMMVLVWVSGREVFGQEEVADISLYSTTRISVQKPHFNYLIETIFGDGEVSEAELASGLYEGYAAGWAQAAREARNDLKLIRAKGRGTGADGYRLIQTEMRARQEVFAREAKALEGRFFDDLQMFLTPAQAGRWGEFEQGLRRSFFLRRYRRLAGEDVDLIKLMKELDFGLAEDIGTKVGGLLKRYGVELDVALQSRQKILPEVGRLLEAIRSGRSNQNGEQYYKSVVLPRHKALREINDRFAEELLAILPVFESKIFKDRFDRLRYPRIFSTSQADRYLKKLGSLDDLTAKQDREIADLLSNYEIEIEPIILRLMELQRDRDEGVPPQYRLANLAVLGESGSGDGVALELATAAGGGTNLRVMELERELWKKRRDIEERLIDGWFEILSAEQQRKAPKRLLIFQPGGVPSGPHDGGDDDDDGGGGGGI